MNVTALPREDLVRMTPVQGHSGVLAVRAAEADDGIIGTITGYPIVYNEWTRIGGWEGDFWERIAPGAVDKTIAERADKIVVQFDHGHDTRVGGMPLGKPSVMRSDDFGLYVEVPLPDTSVNRDLYATIKSGAIPGQSFRFTVLREDVTRDGGDDGLPDDGLDRRTVTELRLYELGPVTFPAYEATKLGVRSQASPEVYRAVQDFLSNRAASEAPVEQGDDTPPAGHLSPEERQRHIRRIRTYAETGVLLTKGQPHEPPTERDLSPTG